ncbi:MAG: DUF2125 domain-containing protein [Micropepsaceae bacterium]
MSVAVETFKNIFLGMGAALRARFVGRFALIATFVPLALVVLALGAYGVWWRTVADSVREQVVQMQALQRSLGRDVRWESFAVEGFPYRVDARLDTLHFTAPDRGSAWDSERIVVRVPPLSPGRVAVSFEGQQHYFYARERWIETNARADKALLTIATGKDGRDLAKLDIERLTGKAKLDETDFNFIVGAAFGGLVVAQPAREGALPQIDASVRVENVALQGAFDLPLGPAIQLIALDVRADLPARLAEPSFAALVTAWRRLGTPVEIKAFDLDWGGVTVAAKGTFTLDQNSLPEGRFRLTLGNHPRILELLEAHGWIDAATRATTKKVLDVLAFMSGDKQRRVTVPLRIEKGDIYVGPAKVATLMPAPTAAMQIAPVEASAP